VLPEYNSSSFTNFRLEFKIDRAMIKTKNSDLRDEVKAMENCGINIIEVCSKLKTLDFVIDIQEIGSRSEGNADRYSDVDLVVNVQVVKPDTALLKITEFMKMTYSPLWVDYANSLMPSKFLVSMFINCENPFCFLDIGIYNHEVINYDPKRFENDKWVHLTKLWIMNFKYYLRKDSCFPQRFKNMMNKANINDYKDELDGFKKLLELLSTQDTVSGIYIDKLCNAIYHLTLAR